MDYPYGQPKKREISKNRMMFFSDAGAYCQQVTINVKPQGTRVWGLKVDSAGFLDQGGWHLGAAPGLEI